MSGYQRERRRSRKFSPKERKGQKEVSRGKRNGDEIAVVVGMVAEERGGGIVCRERGLVDLFC